MVRYNEILDTMIVGKSNLQQRTNKVRKAKLIVIASILKSSEGIASTDEILNSLIGENIKYPISICEALDALSIQNNKDSIDDLVETIVKQGYKIKTVSDAIRAYSKC